MLVAHIGFVIIAAGTTIYWARGFSGETAIFAGQSATIARSGATIKLDRFGYRIDPVQTKSGLVYQPIDYVSHVTVTDREGGTPIRRRSASTIRSTSTGRCTIKPRTVTASTSR